MTLTHIAIFCGLALAYGVLLPARWRGWALLLLSLFALYWLQPALLIRRLDFVLPSLTLFLAVLTWLVTKQNTAKREDYFVLGGALLFVIGVTLTRYLIPELRPTPSRPPPVVFVLIGIAALSLIGQLYRLRGALLLVMLLLIGLFVVLKTDALTVDLSAFLRGLNGQKTDVAAVSDVQWLGFSYIAFRLLHVLRDRQTGILPDLTLREHLTYVIFFSSLTAGPIDRAERFAEDFRNLTGIFAAPRWMEGLGRIGVGVFKKFVVADTLALAALNGTNADQATSRLALWILLYVYTFRIYFDFSGYSDIAIGIGILFGVKLPENFDRPYLKSSLTAFWQSWHITLSNWVRFYVFSPLSRGLLRLKHKPNSQIIIFFSQLCTMLIIGLWHGITINFIIWGIWHGIGLFLHKMWTDRTRLVYLRLKDRPQWQRAWTLAGLLLTFHYVALGWMWFCLPDFAIGSQTFLRLVGVR